jgi:hypothetical protein
MSDSTTSVRPGLLRRVRTGTMFTAVSGLLVLGGYGIATAVDSDSSPSDESTSSAEPSPSTNGEDAARPDAPSEGRSAPGNGSGAERQAPGDTSGREGSTDRDGEPCNDMPSRGGDSSDNETDA